MLGWDVDEKYYRMIAQVAVVEPFCVRILLKFRPFRSFVIVESSRIMIGDRISWLDLPADLDSMVYSYPTFFTSSSGSRTVTEINQSGRRHFVKLT